MATKFDAIMARRGEIMRRALGMDYSEFELSPIAFDYERMMGDHGYSLDDIVEIQTKAGVGHTPLLELHNLTDLVRSVSREPGKGARIFVKDEAANLAGAFKDRRASRHHPRRQGEGLRGRHRRDLGQLRRRRGQPGGPRRPASASSSRSATTAARSASPRSSRRPASARPTAPRSCSSRSVPSSSSHMVELLDTTGYFAASLYSSFGVSGIETLGLEVSQEMRALTGADPTACVITHAGGGNTTGTARGLKPRRRHRHADRGASVDLSGLHMASDIDFNRKSFTTGHTGFGVPFATWPDRADVPRNAARPLRYIDRYLTVTQGEVFYMTEALVKLEGLERGPAGNTAMTAAVSLARELPREATIVVQETEYTGAGKHHWAQLNFARQMGVEVRAGDPRDNKPGTVIVMPERLEQIQANDFDVAHMRAATCATRCKAAPEGYMPTADDIAFLAADINSSAADVEAMLADLAAKEA